MNNRLHHKLLSLLLIALMFLMPLRLHAEDGEAEDASTKETNVEESEGMEEATDETEDPVAEDPEETTETEEPEDEAISETAPVLGEIPAGIFYLQQREKVTIEPDYAVVEIGVSTRNEDFATAVAEVKAAAQALQETLLGFEGAEIEIESLLFQIYNDQDYNLALPVIVAYNPIQMYKVTIHDVDQVGSVLDMAIEAGSNELGSITYKSTEEAAKTLEARQNVLDILDEKAQRLAQAMGTPEAALTLERYDVNYSIIDPSLRVVEENMAYETSSVMSAKEVADEGGMGGGAPVSPGLLEFDVNVHASYTFGEPELVQTTNDGSPQVSIDGGATIATQPDTFRFSFGKETTSPNSAQEAVAENDAIFDAVVESLKALGVTSEQLQTTTYSVTPQHSYNTETPELAGFKVTHNMELTVPADADIASMTEVILGSDLSQVVSGYYLLDDQKSVRQDITVQASRDAYEQFKVLDERVPQAVVVTEVPQMMSYSYTSYYPMMQDATPFDIAESSIPLIELSDSVKVDFVLDK